ncbi:MAG: branched-chain amino acid ABC transporter substrate-binding protein [Acidobacteriota bacterium]|nr:branched-chain amino acid ABC transporter substrate-binding protein [Acidobacteriota bacterium]
MKKNRVLAVVAAVAIATSSFVAFAPSASAACSGKLKIAYQGPLTGPEAALGINELNGVKFALKKFLDANKSANVDPVVYEVDDQGDPAVAAPIAPKVAAEECVVALVGPAYSGASKVSLPVYLSAGLPIITPSATNPTLPSFGKSIFHRAVLTDDYQGPAAARLITSKVKNAAVFLVNDASDYAVGLQKTVDITLAGRVVGKDVTPTGTTDFSATIAKIKKSKANAVFYSGYFSQAAVFVKQLRDSGSKIVFASGDGTLDNQFIKLARKAAEGALLTAPAIPFETASPKLAAEMVKAGWTPGVYTTESFDAANFFLEAIKAGNTDRASINKYVSTKSSKGLSKTLKFDADGEVSGADVNGFIVKNGKLVLLGAIKA